MQLCVKYSYLHIEQRITTAITTRAATTSAIAPPAIGATGRDKSLCRNKINQNSVTTASYLQIPCDRL